MRGLYGHSVNRNSLGVSGFYCVYYGTADPAARYDDDLCSGDLRAGAACYRDASWFGIGDIQLLHLCDQRAHGYHHDHLHHCGDEPGTHSYRYK
ncbi:hypothetical protein D3C81_1323690 [compost metagenome]